jgi:hypothetical protein
MGLNIRQHERNLLLAPDKHHLLVRDELGKVWRCNFIYENQLDCKQIRTLNVLDDCNLKVWLKSDASSRAERSARVFNQLKEDIGLPDMTAWTIIHSWSA